MSAQLQNAIKHWSYIAPLLNQPTNQKELDAMVEKLDELLDIVGNNENHPLMGLIDIMSHIIAAYENAHVPVHAKGIDALRYLMQIHQLRQSDLPEIGSQGVLSEILNGKRKLNLRQIKKLAKRFHIAPNTFIEETK